MRTRGLLVAAACCMLAACLPSQAPSNPYDPALPASQQQKGSISGVVSTAGVGNAPATPLAGASIVLDSTTVVSDANGMYQLTEVQPGGYILAATHPIAYATQVSVTLQAGQSLNQNILMAPIVAGDGYMAHLFGTVEKSGELGLPPAIQDHSGIVVQLVNAGIRTVTDSQGAFDFFVSPGTYSISFSATNYISTQVDGIVLPPAFTTPLPNSPLVLTANPGVVSGVVQLEGQASGAWGGTLVSIAGNGTQTSNADGSFSLTGVAPGTYTLSAAQTGYDSANVAGVVVSGGQTTQLLPVTLAISRGAIVGHAQLTGATDHSGITVALTGTAYTATTSVTGAYNLSGVPVGVYELTARKNGYIVATLGSITVLANASSAATALTLSVLQGGFTINSSAAYTNTATVQLQLSAQQQVSMRLSEDPNFADASRGDVAYRAYNATPSFTLSAADGLKIIYAQYADAASVASNVFASSITLDTQAPISANGGPTLQINGGAQYTNVAGGGVTLNLNAADTVSGVQQMQLGNSLPLTAAWQPYASVLSYTLDTPTVDGSKTVYALFQDGAGNVTAAPAQATITLDTTPPTLTTFSLTCSGVVGATACNTSLVGLSIASPDAVLMALSNNPAFPVEAYQPFVSSVAWPLNPGDGARTVSVKLQDAAGNKSASATLNVDIDTVAPSSPAVSINNDATYCNGLAVTLSLAAIGATQVNVSNCQDFSSGLGCSNTTGWVTLTSTMPWTLSGGDGTKWVYVQFRDAALNLANAKDSILLDSQPPVPAATAVSVAANSASFVNSLSSLLTLNAANADVMQIGCDNDLTDKPWVAYAPAVTCLLPSGDAQKTILVGFADFAGNVATPTSTASVYYDATPPTPPAIGTSSAIVAPTSYPVSLAVVSTDAALSVGEPGGARFAYQLKGGSTYLDWTDCGSALTPLAWAQDPSCVPPAAAGGSFTFALNANNNRLGVRARDRAGNVSAEDTVVISQDNVAPGLVRHQNADSTYGAWGAVDVESGNGYTIVSWEPPADTDVAGYILYYGFDPSAYTGTFANQGTSPLYVGSPCTVQAGADDCSVRLTGLANGTLFYVTVAAYDKTNIPGPNLGARAPGVATTPASLVPTLVGNVPVTSLTPGGQYVRGVTVRDGLAYVTTGDTGNLAVVDVSVPSAPTVMSKSAALLTNGYGVYVHGNYAYVADGTGGLRTFDVTDPTVAPVLVNTAPLITPDSAVAVTGHQDLIYVVGSVKGSPGDLYLFTTASGSCSNTSAPSKPCLLQFNSGNFIDAAVQGQYLYALVGSYLNIYDISTPTSPALQGQVLVNSSPTSVSVSGQYAYVTTAQNSAVTVNISNPAAPVLAATVGTMNNTVRGQVYGQMLFASSGSGFEISQITASNSNITTAANYSLGNLAYNDPIFANGWPNVGMIQAEGNFVYVAGHALGFNIYRSTAIRSMATASTYSAPSAPLALSITGSMVEYTSALNANQSNLTALYANPSNMTPYATRIISGPITDSVAVDSGVTVTSDRSQGHVNGQRLSSNANFINPIVSYTPYTPATGSFFGLGIATRWPYAYVSGSNTSSQSPNMLAIVDLRTYTLTGTVSLPTIVSPNQGGTSVALFGKYAYVNNYTAQPNLFVVDVSTPTAPTVANSLTLGFSPIELKTVGTRLYMAHSAGARILSLVGSGTPLVPVDIGGRNGTPNNYGVGAFNVSGNYLYIAGLSFLQVFDVSNAAQPALLDLFQSGINATPHCLLPVNNTVYVGNQTGLPVAAVSLK